MNKKLKLTLLIALICLLNLKSVKAFEYEIFLDLKDSDIPTQTGVRVPYTGNKLLNDATIVNNGSDVCIDGYVRTIKIMSGNKVLVDKSGSDQSPSPGAIRRNGFWYEKYHNCLPIERNTDRDINRTITPRVHYANKRGGKQNLIYDYYDIGNLRNKGFNFFPPGFKFNGTIIKSPNSFNLNLGKMKFATVKFTRAGIRHGGVSGGRGSNGGRNTNGPVNGLASISQWFHTTGNSAPSIPPGLDCGEGMETVFCEEGSGPNGTSCSSSSWEEYAGSTQHYTDNLEIGPTTRYYSYEDSPGFRYATELSDNSSINNHINSDNIQNDITNISSEGLPNYRSAIASNGGKLPETKTRNSSCINKKAEWDIDDSRKVIMGAPITDRFSDAIDSWMYSNAYVHPGLTESLSIVRNADSKSPFGNNVWSNQTELPSTFMYIDPDRERWVEVNTNNRLNIFSYDLKVQPGKDIWEDYHYQIYHMFCFKKCRTRCVPTCKEWEWREICTGKGRRPRWGSHYDDYDDGNVVCKQVRVCVNRVSKAQTSCAGGCQTTPGGIRTESEIVGEVPPIYARRIVYKYRNGAGLVTSTVEKDPGSPLNIDNEGPQGVEGNVRMSLGNKYVKSTMRDGRSYPTIKSGYGFSVKGSFEVISDSPVNPTNYEPTVQLVRPNKTTNLEIDRNGRLNGSIGYARNPRYDRDKNGPEYSSSVNSDFIVEPLLVRRVGGSSRDRGTNNIRYSPFRLSQSDLERIAAYRGAYPFDPATLNRTRPLDQSGGWSRYEFESDPNRYYHAFWETRGESNLVPIYRPGPIHFINLDYPSGQPYDIAVVSNVNVDGTINTNNNTYASILQKARMYVVGNMWEDSFSRPDFRKAN